MLPSTVVTAAPNEVKHRCQDWENLDTQGEFLYVTEGWRVGDSDLYGVRLLARQGNNGQKSILFSCE